MNKEEKEVLEDELLYDGVHKIKKLKRKTADGEITSEIIKKGDTVSGLIYNTETKKYIFIEKYRIAANGVTLEVISGDVDEGEKHAQAIKRVVTEMTGYKVDDSKVLQTYFMDTEGSDEICTLFYVEVSERVVDDLDFDDYSLMEIEKLGLGGKLFVEDPMNMMTVNIKENKEKKIKPPFQCLDAKTLLAVMCVENNNTLKDIAEVITNAKIRSL